MTLRKRASTIFFCWISRWPTTSLRTKKTKKKKVINVLRLFHPRRVQWPSDPSGLNSSANVILLKHYHKSETLCFTNKKIQWRRGIEGPDIAGSTRKCASKEVKASMIARDAWCWWAPALELLSWSWRMKWKPASFFHQLHSSQQWFMIM